MQFGVQRCRTTNTKACVVLCVATVRISTISIPKTKIITQPAQQTIKPTANDAARIANKTITPQMPLPNQQINKSVNKSLKNAH